MSVSISFRRDNRFSVGFKGDRGISVGKKVPPRKAGKVYRHDWQEPYSYCGVANDGTQENSTGWKIKRIEVLGDASVIVMVAIGAWIDRYTLDYE